MRTVQWYPGHMTAAMRMMEQNIALVQGVVFVLDARCPASSFNPKLKKLAGAKPVLYVLNKGDLADGGADALLNAIRQKGVQAVKINALNSSSRRDVTAAMERIVQAKRERAAERGQTPVFRFMVAGVPNTGKSSLINLLAGGRRAETGDKAGVTRGKQWIRCGGFELLDTPGTMPPAFGNQTFARRLAYVGSINDDILALDEIALCFLEEMYAKYPGKLKERYGIEGGTPLDMLGFVCKSRGFLLRGGDMDYERAYRALLDDFRKGRLGVVSLDSLDDVKGQNF